MRNLTIKRTKSFVACLVKMKVYIEDPNYRGAIINDVPCRKLGEIKNGEEKTFQIGNDEARVFIIADELSKNYCNDFYRIPAGEEDVFLTGKNRYNLASGNAFRFDGVTDEEVLANRKKGTKKGIWVIIGALIVGIIIGFLSNLDLFLDLNSKPETFTADGMQITLTSAFDEASFEGYNVCYESDDVAVLVLKEEFTLFAPDENFTLEEYGNILLEGNDLSSTASLQTTDGITHFEYEYTSPEDGNDYNYFATIYKSDDAYWLIQFVTFAEDADDYRATIMEWAKSVEF